MGIRFREERRRRRWTLRELSTKTGLGISVIHGVEMGRTAGIGTYVRLGKVLGLEIELVDAVRRRLPSALAREVDLVHSAMGELQAATLSALGFPIGVDEPYQHFQFAGRGDIVAWDLQRRAFLHVENRTQFPNVQETSGSWNAKRAYLAPQLAERLGLRVGWKSVTHVMAALWTAEVRRVLRLRTATFRGLCPDPPERFASWWQGNPPASGVSSTLVLFDPCALGKQRRFVSFDEGLNARPRHHGYADVAQCLTANFPQSVNNVYSKASVRG